MNPFWAGVFVGLRRFLARHQGRPPSAARSVPLWRLVLDEVAYLLRMSVRRRWLRVWLPAAVVVATVMVGLAEFTPGPVIAVEWRLVLTAVLVAVTAVVLWPRRNAHP
ncbi:MAG: hypothetical protein M3N57_04575 [Actinomycetota bacterium]|nr:hypothetical protein [Actinomycetota bacterium]